MINEEKVKQLYKVALYEQKEEKMHRQIGRYYRSDYIVKELIKSIFTGTAAYLLMLVLWISSRWESVLDQINRMDWDGMVVPVVLIYIGFMLAYLVCTFFVYRRKYAEFYKQVERYEEELKTLHRMYEREEKIKA